MVQGDPHPIAKYRVIGSLANLAAFQEAFGCKPGARGRSMSPEDIAVELKRFDAPDETRTFAKGRLELVR